MYTNISKITNAFIWPTKCLVFKQFKSKFQGELELEKP